MSQKSYNKENNLYLIPTPIGNLEDITIRSLNLLRSVDVILCEDTRTTGALLKKYDIKNKLMSCHEHNEETVKYEVVKMLEAGKSIGLVTDQGSPIISDPGFKVVDEVIKNNYSVIGIPGATAFVPALISSGISPSKFLFYGFLNSKQNKQLQELENLKYLPFTIIIYEAPHRILRTLENMKKVLGDRKIAICRELSKIHEEIYRGKISEVINSLETIKGELVIIVDGNNDKNDFSNMSIMEHINIYLEDGISEKEALKKVAKERKVPKSIIYKEYHTRK